MYNSQDEMYEVSDLDQDIELRKALIAEAKELMEQEEPDIRDVTNLRKRWNRITYWESAYEDTLMEEFDSYLDAYYAKRRAGYEVIVNEKKKLIQQAESLAASDDFQQATNEMNELMNQWKLAGNTRKDEDDALWEAFNKARQTFFDRKHAYWEHRREQFANAYEIKKSLIEEAKQLSASTDWQKTSDAYRELMAKWKEAGSAGREHEDALWNEFQEARQTFYDARTAHYDTLHEEQRQKYEAKKGLVSEAKAIESLKTYTKEQTAMMKELGNKWKLIGNCGKEKEEQVWSEFRGVMDAYFDGLKQWNEQKHANWVAHMNEIKNRKLDMIQHQKHQIERIKQDMVGLLGQRAIDEAQEEIEDKQAFIAELEADIADIESRLEHQ